MHAMVRATTTCDNSGAPGNCKIHEQSLERMHLTIRGYKCTIAMLINALYDLDSPIAGACTRGHYGMFHGTHPRHTQQHLLVVSQSQAYHVMSHCIAVFGSQACFAFSLAMDWWLGALGNANASLIYEQPAQATDSRRLRTKSQPPQLLHDRLHRSAASIEP